MRKSERTFGAFQMRVSRPSGNGRVLTDMDSPRPEPEAYGCSLLRRAISGLRLGFWPCSPRRSTTAMAAARAPRPSPYPGDRLLEVMLAELQDAPDVFARLLKRRHAAVLIHGTLAGVVRRQRQNDVAAVAVEQHA